MVLIARALASGARVMLLDEPTASLDFRNQATVLATLKRLCAERKMTIVLSSHDPRHAGLVADRALLLRGVSTFDEGPCSDVLTEPKLSKLYGLPIRSAGVVVDGIEARTLFADLRSP
jgi:iron complex transport system ATP-binding protein